MVMMWWPGTELNRRRQPFQGCALPPELPGHVFEPAWLRVARTVRFSVFWWDEVIEPNGWKRVRRH